MDGFVLRKNGSPAFQAKIVGELETLGSAVEAWLDDKLTTCELQKNIEFASKNMRAILLVGDK